MHSAIFIHFTFIILSLINLSCSKKLIRRNKHGRRPIRTRAVETEKTLPVLERDPTEADDNIFLQFDNVIYFKSHKIEAELQACCDAVLRGGISVMVEQITRDLEYVIEARSLYYFLKEKQDCVKTNPRYDLEIRFTVFIEMLNQTDTTNVEQVVRGRIKEYIDEGDLGVYFWRNNFDKAQSISTVYQECGFQTLSPSAIPTVITASPSIPKPPGAVSVLFQVGLAGGKTATELSDCCREQIINSAKKAMSLILGGLGGRKLESSSQNEVHDNKATSQYLGVTRRLQKETEEPPIFCDIDSLVDDPDCSCAKIDMDCQVNFPEDTDTQETEGKMNVALENQAESGDFTQILNEEGVEGEAAVVIATRQPSFSPSASPTYTPSHSPSDFPSTVPSISVIPTFVPSELPTSDPSNIPTDVPSGNPTITPTITHSSKPTTIEDRRIPSSSPSIKPSLLPSVIPTIVESTSPSYIPSMKPSISPSTTPSLVPSVTPTKYPSLNPSHYPSSAPTITPSITPSTSMSPSLIPSYYLVCGSSAGCGGSAPIRAFPDEKHELRCCADEYLGGSWRKNARCSVWSESRIEGKCFHSVDYAEAVDICTGNGARLCTRQELEDNCTQGTGCYHDYDMLWTSTPFSAD